MAEIGDPGFVISDEGGNFYLISEEVLKASKVTDPTILDACRTLNGDDVEGFAFPGQYTPQQQASPGGAPGSAFAPIGGGFQAVRLSPSLGLQFC